MARVDVIREERSGDVGDWQLCLQWARYRLDDGDVLYGYRFVWRRPEDGSIQAARGQARIPSLVQAKALMDAAEKAGWGNRDGDQLKKTANRLEMGGCVVDLGTGYTGWPDKESADKGRLNEDMIADARLMANWAH